MNFAKAHIFSIISLLAGCDPYVPETIWELPPSSREMSDILHIGSLKLLLNRDQSFTLSFSGTNKSDMEICIEGLHPAVYTQNGQNVAGHIFDTSTDMERWRDDFFETASSDHRRDSRFPVLFLSNDADVEVAMQFTMVDPEEIDPRIINATVNENNMIRAEFLRLRQEGIFSFGGSIAFYFCEVTRGQHIADGPTVIPTLEIRRLSTPETIAIKNSPAINVWGYLDLKAD